MRLLGGLFVLFVKEWWGLLAFGGTSKVGEVGSLFVRVFKI